MRWIATIQINVGASDEPVLSPDATAAFFEAALQAVREASGVTAARLAWPEAGGLTHRGRAIGVLFESSSRDGAETVAGDTFLQVALDAGFSALPAEAPDEIGWAASADIEPAEPD